MAAFKTAKDKTAKDIRELHKWRCHTSSFIASLAQPAEVEKHVAHLMGTIENWLMPVLEGWDSGLRDSLREVFRKAIELDKGLSQQKAWWFTQYPYSDKNERFNMRYDSSQMEGPDLQDNQQPNVILVIRPALVKAGDSRGEYYDNPQIATKSFVTCDPAPSRRHRIPRPQIPGMRPALSTQSGPANMRGDAVRGQPPRQRS